MERRTRNIIDKLAGREFRFHRTHPSPTHLVEQFDRAIRKKPGAFAWVGIIAEKDEHQRERRHVYLSERTGKSDECVPVVVDAFNSLALSLEPRIFLRLHLIREADCPPDELREKFLEACSVSEHRKLIWDETL